MRRMGNFRGSLSGLTGLVCILTLAGCDSLMLDDDEQTPSMEQTAPDSSETAATPAAPEQDKPAPLAPAMTKVASAPAEQKMPEEKMPEQKMAEQKMPETAPPKQETVVQPMPMDHRTIYLASYRTEKRALMGFHQLQGKSQGLKDATPVYKTVDIPHKGHFVRLFADVSTPTLADQACNDLIKMLPDCGSGKR